MLTRFVRIQLAIFAVVSVVGVAMMVTTYLQVPTLLGIGRITVRMELPAAGGLYRFANVTYRGKQVGKVTSVNLTLTGAEAVLSLASSPKIPVDLVAEVRSVSAIGEQYVELKPRNAAPPFLADGSVISASATTIPHPVGPMLDKLSAMLGSIPNDKLNALVDESFTAFQGSGYDLGSLFDSATTISKAMERTSDQSKTLIDDSRPVFDAQVRSADATRRWARALAGVTAQLAHNDPQLRTILQTGPQAAQEVSSLLASVKPTLPVLLANLTSLSQVAVIYLSGLRQLLVLLPPSMAYYQSSGSVNNPTGLPVGDFHIQISDPATCTVGFLPPSQWRSPEDFTSVDTPDNLYCKLPQDAPIGVRGVRNLPCMRRPGKRAPTVEICDSDKPYMPLVMRQHTWGPYPLDPNLMSQGVPPDIRVPSQSDSHIFGPVEGTPPAAGTGPGPVPVGPPTPSDNNALAPIDVPSPTDPNQPTPAAPTNQAPPTGPAGPHVTPNALRQSGTDGPSVAVANYDPRTGRYLAGSGMAYQQLDLASSPAATWRDLLARWL